MKKSGLADSPFFAAPPSPRPVAAVQVWNVQPTPAPAFARSDERKSERTPSERSENRTVGLPQKRRTKRYSFEFYEDQLLKLKQLKFKTEMAGESIHLSAMVRDALDLYLKDQEV